MHARRVERSLAGVQRTRRPTKPASTVRLLSLSGAQTGGRNLRLICLLFVAVVVVGGVAVSVLFLQIKRSAICKDVLAVYGLFGISFSRAANVYIDR